MKIVSAVCLFSDGEPQFSYPTVFKRGSSCAPLVRLRAHHGAELLVRHLDGSRLHRIALHCLFNGATVDRPMLYLISMNFVNALVRMGYRKTSS
jgi:hypothetical protein